MENESCDVSWGNNVFKECLIYKKKEKMSYANLTALNM